MEFREYWQIIWRRRTLIVPLVAITFIASLVLNLALPPTYKTDTTVYVQAVIPPPVPNATEYYSPEYYRTVYSEYLADDLTVIVKSRDFAQKTADRMSSRFGDKVGVKDVQDAIAKTQRLHRSVKITIATASESMAAHVAQAMDDVLEAEGWKYFTTDERRPVMVKAVDRPRDPTAPGILRRLLEVLLHTSVAAVVGVGLAFLLHYLDDHIRDEDDAARTLGWPVLASIPVDKEAGTAETRSLLPAWAGFGPRSWRRTPAA